MKANEDYHSRFQWSRGEKFALSSTARILGSLVLILLRAWMCTGSFSVFILLLQTL
jgi:hypothetical protein